MIRSLATKTLASAALFLACLGAGCGSADDSAAVTCKPDTFRLVGAIDDMSIDVTEPASGGFFQINGGDFVSLVAPSALPDSYTDLHVTWPGTVLTGSSSSATATVKIPTSPYPNDVFCAGEGTTVHITNDTISFHLATLTSGTGCATPRRGALDACMGLTQ